MNSHYSPVKWVSLDTVLGLPVHPKAKKYRLLGVDDENDTNLTSIAKNMAEYGFDDNHSLVIFRGQLLDGRNRRAAAEIAGLQEVPVREFFGSEEAALRLISQANDLRRHDGESQRAWAVVGEWDELAAQAKERQKASQAKPGEKVGSKVVPRVEPPYGAPLEGGSTRGTTLGDGPLEGGSTRGTTLGDEPRSLGRVCEILADRVCVGKSVMHAAHGLDVRYQVMRQTIVENEFEAGELEDEVARLLKEAAFAEIDGRLEDRNELQKKLGVVEGRLSKLRKSISDDQQEVQTIESEIAKGTSVITLFKRLSNKPKVSRIPDKKKAVEAYDNLRRGARIIERSLNYIAACSGPDCFRDEAKEVLDSLVGLGWETVSYDPPKRFEVAPESNSPVVPRVEPLGNGSENGDSPVVPRVQNLKYSGSSVVPRVEQPIDEPGSSVVPRVEQPIDEPENGDSPVGRGSGSESLAGSSMPPHDDIDPETDWMFEKMKEMGWTEIDQ